MLETRRDVAYGARDLRIDRITGAARRGGVVRFVEDQQRLRGELAEPVAQSRSISLINEKAVGDQKAGVGGPRIDREAAFAAHPRNICAVENGESETETGLQLILPLVQHRRRTRNDDPVDAAAQQQFARNEPGFDGLAKPDVVGDEQVNARQSERLAQWVELVGVDADAGAERRLKEIRVGCRHAVPRQRAEIGREQRRIVEALVGNRRPAVVLKHAGVELMLPQHRERLALRVVVEARQIDERRLVGRWRRRHVLDEIPALAHQCDPAGFWRASRHAFNPFALASIAAHRSISASNGSFSSSSMPSASIFA